MPTCLHILNNYHYPIYIAAKTKKRTSHALNITAALMILNNINLVKKPFWIHAADIFDTKLNKHNAKEDER